MGIIPLSIQVHKNVLNLFYNTITNVDSVECRVAKRQLAIKELDDNSFFSKARRLLLLYSLPNAYSLMEDTPTKPTWKAMLNDTINRNVETQWKEEILTKTSLKYLNPESVKPGQSHLMYRSVRPNQIDVKRAEVKVRLLTGTYTLQSNRAVFNQFSVDPTCKMCKDGPETRTHFVATCQALQTTRNKYQAKTQSS